MTDHDETRELDRKRVRETLGGPGERDTCHSGERIDPSRDQEARERLEEPPLVLCGRPQRCAGDDRIQADAALWVRLPGR